MAINVTVVRKWCGDLQAEGFQNEAAVVQHFLTYLHFNDPETQLKWLEELRDKILPGAIEDFKSDFGLSCICDPEKDIKCAYHANSDI